MGCGCGKVHVGYREQQKLREQTAQKPQAAQEQRVVVEREQTAAQTRERATA